MKIGIVGPFDPQAVTEYLSSESKLNVISINRTASSINVLVKSLLDSGHKLVVITSDYNSYSDSLLSGEQISIHIIGLKKRNSFLKYFFTIKKLESCISNEISGIDVLHAQWTYNYAYACGMVANRIPVACTVRDWAPYIFSCESRLHIKFFLYLQMILSRKVLDNYHIHFIANSYYTKQRILSLYPHYDIPIIFNSIEDSCILKNRDVYPTQFTFVSIANSVGDKRKNFEQLFKAFSIVLTKYSDVKLIVIGDVKYDVLYKKWEKKRLLRNVEFMGLLNHDKLMKTLDNVSCLVHPSLEETFGNILLEGMARRIPIIAGKFSGAVPLVLKEGKCGCLCDVTDPISISEAMFKVIEDTIYVKSIVENATSVLLSEYASSIVAQNHIKFYESIMK